MSGSDHVVPEIDRMSGRASLVLALLAIGLSLVGFVGRVDAAAVSAGILLVVALWFPLIAYQRRRRPPQVPERTEIFAPFMDLTIDDVWDREADVDRISTAINETTDGVVVVVGPSGVGKTTLLKVLVPDRLAAIGHASGRPLYYKRLTAYAGLPASLEAELAKAPSDGWCVFVLDQFEQWLGAIRDMTLAERQQERSRLGKLILDHSEAATFVISLRAEWYYDLRFLGRLVPSLPQACNVDGIPTSDRANEMRRAMLRDFTELLDDEQLANSILDSIGASGRVSPLEAKIVGAAIERQTKHHTPRNSDLWLNIDGFRGAGDELSRAFDAFYGAILRGARNREVCLKILCALSIETRFRRELKASELANIIFEPPEAIQEAVAYLCEQGIVTRPRFVTLDVAHDAVAEYFHRVSAEMLRPIARDNIFVHAQSTAPGSKVIDAAPRRPYGTYVGAVTAVAMLFRLLSFGINWTVPALGPNVMHPVFGSVFDASYVPVFVAQLGWIPYMAGLYDGIFHRLRESKVQRVLSLCVLVAIVVAAAVGAVGSAAWILAIAGAGTVSSLKMALIALRKDLNQSAREQVVIWATLPLFLAGFLGLLGATQLYIGLNDVHPANVNDWIEANCVASLMIYAAAWLTAPVQISASARSLIIGLIARPKGASAASSAMIGAAAGRVAEESATR